MSKFDKLKERILKEPRDFTYEELKTLLSGMGYVESNKGKTSGSRVAFIHSATSHILRIHKPHPKNIIKQYALRFIIEELKNQHKL
ncbi:MAG: type II toxin-antitoxin system HicA family toxin [Bacteroidetes bacterium]|nr:type II toxin-antitoxin system HicA family toxin [Bacteroidota bacterium]